MEARLLFVQFAQLVFSTLLIFLLMVVIVETVLTIFRIKNARVRAIIRAVPLLKLPLDIFFSRDSLFIDLNILSCTSFLKQWVMPLVVAEEKLLLLELTLSQYIALQIPSAFTSFCMIFLILFVGFTIYKTLQLLYAFCMLKKICKMADVCDREITNLKLKQKIKSKKVEILITSTVTVPCAIHPHAIVFPKSVISELSQEEFEAVVAHELEHLCWYDPLIKFVTILISKIFFWLPTSFWLKHLEDEQEHASDISVHQYGLNEVSLATAIFKITKMLHQSQPNKPVSLYACGLIKSSHSSLKRFQAILKEPNQETYSLFQYCGLTIMALAAVMIGFKLC